MENIDTLTAVLAAVTSVLAAVAGLFVAFSKSIPSLLRFYGERVLTRYALFLSEAKDNEELKGYVRTAQEAEILRGIFGKPVSPKMASEIMALYRTGQFSLPELIACFKYGYMSLGDDDSLEIKPGRIGGYRLVVWVFAPIVTLLGSLFIYISMNMSLRQHSVLWALFTLVQIGSLLVVSFGIGSYRERFQFARKAKEKLAEIKASNPIGGKSTAYLPAGSLTDFP